MTSHSSERVLPKPGHNFWERGLRIRDHYEKSQYRRFFVFFVDGICDKLLRDFIDKYTEDFSLFKN